MAFKLNQNAYNSGTSRRGTIPDITAEMMQRVFGDPVCGEGYVPGIGSEAWYFVSDDGQVVSAYDMMGGRGHGLGIGAHSDAIVEPFAAWLRSEVQKSQPNNLSSARHNSSSCLLIRVAGVTFDDRQRTVAQLNPMEAIRLRRDLRNSYDCYAVRIETLAGNQIGFVPREQSAQVSALLDLVGGIALGWVQQVIGGAPNYPNYGVIVGLELPDALFRQAPGYGHGPQQFYKDDDDTFYEEDNSLPDGWDYET